MFSFSDSGPFKKTEEYLLKISRGGIFAQLSRYGQEGVNALAAATPKDTGLTADSWYYEIIQDATSWSIVWGNSYVVDSRPIAVLLQYGHGTGTGGYVEGRDYINPALRPVFDRISRDAWKVVTSG